MAGKKWRGSDQDKWRESISPRWGFLHVNGKGYLYHTVKEIKYSKSLGNLLKYESLQDMKRRVKTSDDEVSSRIGSRRHGDRTLGKAFRRYRDRISRLYEMQKITRNTYDERLRWVAFHENGIFGDMLEIPVGAFSPNADPEKLRKLFKDYFKVRSESPGKSGTISKRHLNKELSYLGLMFAFLEEEGDLDRSPIAEYRDQLMSWIDLHSPRRPDVVPKKDMVEKYERWKRIRHHLWQDWEDGRLRNSQAERILLFQSMTGMRVSEVRRMVWEESNPPKPVRRDVRTIVLTSLTEVEITSKGKVRTRRLPLRAVSMLEFLREEAVNDFGSLPEWVFPSPEGHGGEPSLAKPLTGPSVSRRFKHTQQRMGEDEPFLVSHENRNFVITDLLERGVPETEIQMYVGHSTRAMTRHYIREDVLSHDGVVEVLEDWGEKESKE